MSPALRNRIIDFYRNPSAETVSLDSEDENGLSLFDVLPDAKYDPESSYHRHAQHRLVFDLIRELPEAQLEVIIEPSSISSVLRITPVSLRSGC